MSKITKAADAPEGEINISYGTVSFAVSDGVSFETDDFAVVAQAELEPWLDVEKTAPAVEPVEAGEPQNVAPVTPEGEPVVETVTDPKQEAVQEESIENAPVAEADAQPTDTTPWKRR